MATTPKGVIFYEHRDYDGNAYGPMKPGSYGWVEDVGIPNDNISSWRWSGLEDPNNGYVTFYEHRNFGGKEHEFQGDVKYVGDPLNDRLSSFKVRIDEAAERKAVLDKRLAEAQREADERKLNEQIAIISSGGSVTPGSTGGASPFGGTASGALRTYEIFGVINGQPVPITRAVTNSGGRWQLVPGARVLVGDSASDGFGLAGTPGRWSAWYSTQSPAAFGLDADKAVLASDGSRGWVTEAAWLSQIFGPNWRSVVY
jgi:hypothetical protein